MPANNAALEAQVEVEVATTTPEPTAQATATPTASPMPKEQELVSFTWNGQMPAPNFVTKVSEIWGQEVSYDADVALIIQPGENVVGGFGTVLVPEWYTNGSAILNHSLVNYDKDHQYLTPFSHSFSGVVGPKCAVYEYAKQQGFTVYPYVNQKFVRIHGLGVAAAVEGFNWKEPGSFFLRPLIDSHQDTIAEKPTIYYLSDEHFSFKDIGVTLGCEPPLNELHEQ
jgi:hypothetical protein